MIPLARFVLRHRLAVAVSWLVLFVAGIAGAGALSSRLTLDFSLPGQPGYVAEQQLLQRYGVPTFDTLVPAVTVPNGRVESRWADIGAVFAELQQKVPGLLVVDYPTTGDKALLTADGRSTFALVNDPFPVGFGTGVTSAALILFFAFPALASLLGSWNWWLPARAAMPLQVEPSPRVHPLHASTEPVLAGVR